jgi:hypothetical protein
MRKTGMHPTKICGFDMSPGGASDGSLLEFHSPLELIRELEKRRVLLTIVLNRVK